MLKAHQACIDLSKNVLRIQGREVEFLSEHELPENARREATVDELHPPIGSSAPGPSSGASPNPPAPSFPGGGSTIGAPPSGQPAAGRPPATSPQPAQKSHPEEHIRILMDLGATRDVAMRSLDAAGGNIDVAASLLF
ncbi:hypothetical protein FPV67DRAFT_432384 [Lyophyllum atratum]|nr:hypothetical protein FPV67DRAFT_432384 [Lyophyllum atratum]